MAHVYRSPEKPKQMQVADFYNKHVKAANRSAFLQEMRKWEDDMICPVWDSFYDTDLMHIMNTQAKEQC